MLVRSLHINLCFHRTKIISVKCRSNVVAIQPLYGLIIIITRIWLIFTYDRKCGYIPVLFIWVKIRVNNASRARVRASMVGVRVRVRVKISISRWQGSALAPVIHRNSLAISWVTTNLHETYNFGRHRAWFCIILNSFTVQLRRRSVL